MRVKLAVVAAAIAVGLTLTGVASARLVDQGVAQGSTPTQLVLAATDTTTAYGIGVWTFSPATVTVTWQTNSIYPQNDRSGQFVLETGPFAQSGVVYFASRQVGTPWRGWDFTTIVVTLSADFGQNPDGSAISSAISGWLVSHD